MSAALQCLAFDEIEFFLLSSDGPHQSGFHGIDTAVEVSDTLRMESSSGLFPDVVIMHGQWQTSSLG